MAGVTVKWKDNTSGQDMHQKSIVLHGRQTGGLRIVELDGVVLGHAARAQLLLAEAVVRAVVRRSVQPQVEQPDDRRQPPYRRRCSWTSCRDFPETPVYTSPGQRGARPGQLGHAALGRRLVGAQVRHLLRHHQHAPARRSGLRARIGDGGRLVEQGVVHLHGACSRASPTTGGSAARRWRTGPSRGRPTASRRRAARRSRRRPRACRPRPRRRRSVDSELDRCRLVRKATRSSASSRAARHGRRLARRPADDDVLQRRQQRADGRNRPTTTACARSRPAAIRGYSNIATVTTPFPTVSHLDVVLYASEAPVRVGTWAPVADATAAGGSRLNNRTRVPRGVDTPLGQSGALLRDELHGAGGRAAIRIWMRGKAYNNSGYNDSVHVQFSDSVNRPEARPPTASARRRHLRQPRGGERRRRSTAGAGRTTASAWACSVRSIYFADSGTADHSRASARGWLLDRPDRAVARHVPERRARREQARLDEAAETERRSASPPPPRRRRRA